MTSISSRVTLYIVGTIERSFLRHGERVGQHPWRHITVAVFLVLLSVMGFLRFRQEKHPLRLWIPQNSDFLRDTNWLISNYGEGLRIQYLLVTADDVLQPHVLNQLLDIHLMVHSIAGESPTWEDVCFKVPIINFNTEPNPEDHLHYADSWENYSSSIHSLASQGPSSDTDSDGSRSFKIQEIMTDESFDPSQYLGDVYCDIVKRMKRGCLQNSILDLWKYNPKVLLHQKKLQIVRRLNSSLISPTMGHPVDFKSLLGGVVLNKEGAIISAKASLSMWMVHVNFSIVDMDEVGNSGGTADWANGPGLEWEENYLKVMKNASTNTNGIKIFYEAGRSFGDVSASGMFQDMDKLVLGVMLMLMYVQFNQTQCSWIKSRMFPCAVGLLCVGLAFISACGICSLCGIPYGPVHTSLPFLMLGIGVDDMFVILNCWDQLPKEESRTSLPTRLGVAMSHAGLSITITSATDFVAFMIGSSTVLPSLQSFCMYAAVGILLTFFLQLMVFVPVLALDQYRMEKKRNFVIPCLIHASVNTENEQSSLSFRMISYCFSKVFLTKLGKGLIILLTIIFFSLGVVGNLRLKQEFDPEWFIDDNSYLFQFLQKRNEYFPDVGNRGAVYLGQLKYNEELPKIGKLTLQLTNQSNILKNFDNWFSSFYRYVQVHHAKDIYHEVLSDDQFRLYISRYLFSPSGSRYQKNFKFSKPLLCGHPASDVTVASFDFIFRQFKESKDCIAAMNLMKATVKNANFTTGDKFAMVWAKTFANWVTDEVISSELYRNLALAVLCVGGSTAVFMANPMMSAWVLLCVLLTLVDVAGFMYFWGLTIDLVSCIALILAVGLCVDFAAHIGYAFLSCQGTRHQRSLQAVSYIGRAVLNGGVTTLLALSVLVLSNSYIFKAFFKIFLLVILFGLFHGLLFLPVVLSLIGPAPYRSLSDKKYNQQGDNEPEMSALRNLEENQVGTN